MRPGLGSLPRLRDLRFRSTKRPLAFNAAASPLRPPAPGPVGLASVAASGAPLLPAQLIKLRLEGCHLAEARARAPGGARSPAAAQAPAA